MTNFKLPEFSKTIIEKYKSFQNNQFLLYGNINDIYPYEEDNYLPLNEFLEKALILPEYKQVKKIIINYDLAKGLEIPYPEDKELLQTEFSPNLLDQAVVRSINNPLIALNFLVEATKRTFYRFVENENQSKAEVVPLAIIIKYADSLLPEGTFDRLSDTDRQRITLFLEWFSSRKFSHSTNIVFLISETLSSVNYKIRDLPYLAPIMVTRPNSEMRENFIEKMQNEYNLELNMEIKQVSFFTAGLSLVNIQQIFNQASYSKIPLTVDSIFSKTKEIIEKELSGHVEIQDIDYGFEKVIGATKLKNKLIEIKKCIDSGNVDLMPTGILVPGPNGVGKTFIFKAFAKECGWITVVLKNIRGAYVGETESRWEMIRNVLESMGKVLVFYDEADTQLGGRGPYTHDVDKRLFGSIMSMMSANKNRGRIIWIIITARPDKLEPDIKRSGRAGEHLAVFDPEDDEKDDFLEWILKKVGIEWNTLSDEEKKGFLEKTNSYSAADYEELLHHCQRRKFICGEFGLDELFKEVSNFIPTDISLQRELQQLVALVECTTADLIPSKFKDLSKADAFERIREIKNILREDI
ncbi:MAG: AAA family ATPase [Candidatus Coatesbacteria bacterium]|nr:AAA family ATPase [Candidatus Coatesbacteria bacterium]